MDVYVVYNGLTDYQPIILSFFSVFFLLSELFYLIADEINYSKDSPLSQIQLQINIVSKLYNDSIK